MKDSDVAIKSRDLRVGMGIGGWDMEYTLLHTPSKCSLTLQSHGLYPRPQHELLVQAMLILEFMVEIYEDTP